MDNLGKKLTYNQLLNMHLYYIFRHSSINYQISLTLFISYLINLFFFHIYIYIVNTTTEFIYLFIKSMLVITNK